MASKAGLKLAGRLFKYYFLFQIYITTTLLTLLFFNPNAAQLKNLQIRDKNTAAYLQAVI